ncbi:tetratricopeptide repeat protein [Streptomyces sp. NPDC050418]|uniref:tetratricopeptide repeat protein n=1 Tax=Streptomyces sp. NPDC050418 TaxID=3365612 RepID=UPI00378F6BF9
MGRPLAARQPFIVQDVNVVAPSGGVGAAIINNLNQYLPPRPATVWPVRMGAVPPLASAFQPRTDLRERIDAAGPAVVLSGGGGVGKSHLAAACAHQALADGTDLVLWVDAADPQRIEAEFAEAAYRVGANGAEGQDTAADAAAFRDWLATTTRSWLVVLDQLADGSDLVAWWPPRPASGRGRVLATTRLRDAVLSGGGRATVDVDVYEPGEAAAYLRERLGGAGRGHLADTAAGQLLHALGSLPLAVSHAAAYLINEEVTCADYLRLFTDQRSRLDALLPPEADTEGYGRPVAAALLLTLDAAQRRAPLGLAAPALCLSAHLDPSGHPLSLWADEAVREYLGRLREQAGGSGDADGGTALVTEQEARGAVRLLHRYGLLASDPEQNARAVRIHALTARATRENTSEELSGMAILAAADALVLTWPDQEHTDRELAAALRANAQTLTALAGELLWRGGDDHPLPYVLGHSLTEAGAYGAAITHWQRLIADVERRSGPDQPGALYARDKLVDVLRLDWRVAEAASAAERLVADYERLAGEDSVDTASARGTLAICYWLAGRAAEAVALAERTAGDLVRLLGADHPESLTARHNVAAFYTQVGRAEEAVAIEEEILPLRERLLGEDDPATLTSRSVLAAGYVSTGRDDEGIALEERVLDDRVRVLGADHPTTLENRGSLAGHYYGTGRISEAVALQEQVLADAERALGADHPTTVLFRGNLAAGYAQSGQWERALPLQERAAADAERVLGAEDPYALMVRNNLGDTYTRTGRYDEAVAVLEQVVEDSERVLGEDHPDTSDARGNLGAAYLEAGRAQDAVPYLERFAADCEAAANGQDHAAVRAWINVAAALQRAGAPEEAVEVLEQLAEETVRQHGPGHELTLETRAALAIAYRKVRRVGATLRTLGQVIGGAARGRRRG